MKEQAYNIIKTKDSRTQRQSNLNKSKEARFKISPQEFEDYTLGEIVSLKYVYKHGSSESVGYLLKEASLRGILAVWVPPFDSTFEVGGPSFVSSPPPHLLGREAEIATTYFGVGGMWRRIDAFDVDIGFIERDATRTSDDVLALQDRLEREFFSMRIWLSEVIRWGAMEARPSKSIDILAIYGESQPPRSGPPDEPCHPEGVGRSRSGNNGGAPEIESVFEISKCAEDDKVKFVVCTLKGCALTWWNRNVHSLGITAANKIPWNELKTMMMAEYCPRTEILK
ncbi:hypothetical protein Tco_0472662 [Tanacetum coccineum]